MTYGEAIKNLEEVLATDRPAYLKRYICPICPSTESCTKGGQERMQCLVDLARNFTPMFGSGRPQ